MIILLAHRVVRKSVIYVATGGLKPRLMAKWKNDYKFGFDTTDPNAWRNFLEGMDLPRKDKYGEPVSYRCFIWGGIKGAPRGISGTTLFPGKDKDGKTLPLYPYGLLRNKRRG